MPQFVRRFKRHYEELEDGTIRGWNEYAVIICPDCGRRVTLHGFTNTCECGADFNAEGAKLAPRSQWGEETGETASDILMGWTGALD